VTLRIGVDTGGTFTDVVAYDAETGAVHALKTPSTPPRFDRGVLTGIDRALSVTDRAPAAVDFLAHGTTVGTNAVLEDDLPEMGLVTNEGLTDVLAIGDQTRPSLYDLQVEAPDPPIPRRHRHGVPGRVDADGEVVEPLDEAAVHEVAERLVGAVDTVVVATLHSYLEDDHERRIAEVCEEHGLSAVRSSAVHPEVREYERTVTTALNAGVRVPLGAYLDRLTDGVAERGIPAPVNVMHSGGGLFSTTDAVESAVRTVLSGPAAAGVALRALAEREGTDHAVGLDVGGTSADVTVVRGGDLVRTTGTEVGGYPVETPTIDVRTVGEGGGSVVRVDEGGAVRVGPDSAGADPGPACYGRGGDRPTLTDATLLLGRLPDRVAGGDLALDRERARAAFQPVAEDLGASVERAALAAVRVADAGLARAVRRVTVERGHDPGEFVLVTVGGAGPLSAATVAREVGARAALVPPDPGTFSARGLLAADVRVDESRSFRGTLSVEAVAPALADLRSTLLDRVERQGFDPATATVAPAVDLRYEGQSHELTVDLPTDPDEAALTSTVERFHDAHERRYGHAAREEAVEAVTMRATATVETPGLEVTTATVDREPSPSTRSVRFADGTREAKIRDRATLAPGASLRGPAVVEESGATTLVPPGAGATVTDGGSLRVEWD
jgi:N-methylhydantoinase A